MQMPSQQALQAWPDGDARNLLKEATVLKRAKRYEEAVAMLRRAYDMPSVCPLMIGSYLRLPMYLQLAGKNDEGWDELNRLSVKYVDQWSQPRIAHQMRIFLQNENNETASNPVRVILRGENKPMPLSLALERTDVTIAELQNSAMPRWMTDSYNGFRFSATLQLGIPLRVLLRHGEVYLKNDGGQPQITHKPGEGFWLPNIKTFKEPGIDLPEFPPREHASDIGPIRPDDYLPFLIAMRRIIEAHDPIENRIEMLRGMPMEGNWRMFVSRYGPSYISGSRGIDWVIECFFPLFIRSIPQLTAGVVDELCRLGLDTPNRIAATSDERLLGINGIGPAKLKEIRERCACIIENRDADRFENVIR